MTNEETKKWLLEWCNKPHLHFNWPTDRCGYNQHIKFVNHRNEKWKGGNADDYNEFVREYANALC